MCLLVECFVFQIQSIEYTSGYVVCGNSLVRCSGVIAEVAYFVALSYPFLLCPNLGRRSRSFLGARVHQKAETGRCEGRKPYGFFEGEGDVLNRIKALRGEGSGFDRLACEPDTDAEERMSKSETQIRVI
jgi:hypothetical protein